MKAKKCVLILNNACGYCYLPKKYESISAAKRARREAIESGFAWYGRIFY